MFRPMDLLLVLSGGAIGSGLRYLIGQAPFVEGGIPWPTLLVNLIGTFVLGYIVGRGQIDGSFSRPTMLFLGPGLCGGFTTYSAFAVETTTLLERHALPLMLVYVTLTIIGGLLMAFLGIFIARSTA